ncbi:hypothetical protein MMC24_000897 [Lignoscripta atroalba]|nr:hypothetical protein [Lignoscripta atroalba]
MTFWKNSEREPAPSLSHGNPSDETIVEPASPKSRSPPDSTTKSTVSSTITRNGNSNSKSDEPHPGLVRRPTVQTQYMDMLLHMDTIPRLDNFLSSFFTWLLLAGYVVFPGTFTTISDSDNNKLTQAWEDGNAVERTILAGVRNAPLMYIAAICCSIGGCGMVWLWWKWRRNYVWIVNSIFLYEETLQRSLRSTANRDWNRPGLLNSFAGLISTFINIYCSQNGEYSITAMVTIIVAGACSVINALLFFMYNSWPLRKVKKSHARELERDEKGYNDEGIAEKGEREAREPGLEPERAV